MRTPVTLITGVEPEAMAATMVSLLWDMPQAVAVRHHIDVGRQLLVRTVSDATGVIEHEEVKLEHACVSCAIREDVIPTLDRVARDGRWTSILAHLPVGATADQICAVSSRDRQVARTLRVSSVVTARGPHRVRARSSPSPGVPGLVMINVLGHEDHSTLFRRTPDATPGSRGDDPRLRSPLRLSVAADLGGA